jgi:hypothetical protein
MYLLYYWRVPVINYVCVLLGLTVLSCMFSFSVSMAAEQNVYSDLRLPVTVGNPKDFDITQSVATLGLIALDCSVTHGMIDSELFAQLQERCDHGFHVRRTTQTNNTVLYPVTGTFIHIGCAVLYNSNISPTAGPVLLRHISRCFI